MSRVAVAWFALIVGCLLPASGVSAADLPERTIRSQLTARRYAVISSELAAKIDRLPLREGGSFREGDLLIAFDDSLQRAQLARARAALDAAERTYAANARLQELNSIGQLAVDLAKADLAKAAAELTYADAMLAKCSIKAPYAGRIADMRVREKEFVQAGQPLFEIIDDAVPELEFIVPSKWLAWMAPGQPLSVTIDETTRVYPAVIDRIGAKVDPVSRTVKVVATITGSHPELAAGMSGAIQLDPPASTESN